MCVSVCWTTLPHKTIFSLHNLKKAKTKQGKFIFFTVVGSLINRVACKSTVYIDYILYVDCSSHVWARHNTTQNTAFLSPDVQVFFSLNAAPFSLQKHICWLQPNSSIWNPHAQSKWFENECLIQMVIFLYTREAGFCDEVEDAISPRRLFHRAAVCASPLRDGIVHHHRHAC